MWLRQLWEQLLALHADRCSFYTFSVQYFENMLTHNTAAWATGHHHTVFEQNIAYTRASFTQQRSFLWL